MSETFRLLPRENGTFDPDCLTSAGQPWVTSWLKERLSGQDPYFPIDKRGGEDPESLIVAILRDAGMAHPAYNLIAQGVLDLLDKARKLAPETPPYLEPALQICERVRLPLTSTWFTEELGSLAADPAAVEGRWGDRLVKEILHGAILQSPGLSRTASHASWQAILKMPKYSTLAWMGLAPSFAASVDLMVDWWQACPAAQRQTEIDQLIFTGLKTEGVDEVLAFLDRPSRAWPATLKAAVDFALEKNGVLVAAAASHVQHVQSTRSTHEMAILGAARRREIVLQEQRTQAA